jgi:hypothetical protein
MFGRLVYQRLRRVMLPDLRKVWTRDLDARVKTVQDSLEVLQAEVGRLRRSNRRLELLNEWNERSADTHALDIRLALEPIRSHIREAVANAAVEDDPATHVVIENVLPADFYSLLLETIPPPEFFPDRDPVKQDLEIDALSGTPKLTARVWGFFDQRVVHDVLGPAIFERFRPAVAEHYSETAGPVFGDQASVLPHQTVAGRIMLRRPGYHLRPHLDPKRVVVTGLMYLARPADSDEYGTQLFRVNQPFVADGMKTFFPEEAGLRCEVARTIPYRPNTLLAFVNSRAAHGATLPPGASLHERYSYQFYLKPVDGPLRTLLRQLPENARAPWREWLDNKK